MNTIFKDDAHQRVYAENGFIVLPLLNAEEVDSFKEYYRQYDMQPDQGGFYATMHHPDSAQKVRVSQWITKRISRALERYVEGYRPLFGNFIVKDGMNMHEVGIHQDWTYVDETSYRSFNVWTSLCDTHSENGGMYVLPKSHQVQMPIRYTPFEGKIYETYRQEIKAASIPVELKAGEAMIYDSALLHFSNKNRTASQRHACGCVFVPSEVDALHYFKDEDGLKQYNCDPDFFHELVPGERPNRVPREIIDFVGEFDVLAFEALLQKD